MKVVYKVEGPLSRTQVVSNHIEEKLVNNSFNLIPEEGLDIHPGGTNMCKTISEILDNIVCPPELIDYVEMFQIINTNGVTGYIKLIESGVAVVVIQSYNHDKTWRYLAVGFIGSLQDFTNLRKHVGLEPYYTIPEKPFLLEGSTNNESMSWYTECLEPLPIELYGEVTEVGPKVKAFSDEILQNLPATTDSKADDKTTLKEWSFLVPYGNGSFYPEFTDKQKTSIAHLPEVIILTGHPKI